MPAWEPIVPAPASSLQSATSNPPRCPVCRQRADSTLPVMLAVLDDNGALSGQSIGPVIFCGECGVPFLVTP